MTNKISNSTVLLLIFNICITQANDHLRPPSPSSDSSTWKTNSKHEAFFAVVAIICLISILGYAMWKAGICNISESHFQPSRSPQQSQSFTIGSLLASMGNSGPGGATTQYSRLNQEEEEDA